MVKKAALFIPVFYFLSSLLYSQTPNFSEHIAPILYDNCTPCHHSGGIGEDYLIIQGYADAYANRFSIMSATSDTRMPPWPPDTSYQRYVHERVLNQNEIDAIVDWVNSNAPQGDPAQEPTVPVFPDGARLGPADMVLQMPVYASNANTSDEYICFTLDPNLTQDRFIRAIEVVPGNPAIVHHALVYQDTSASIINTCIGLGEEGTRLLAGYTPGTMPTIFPEGENIKMGVRLETGANIVMQLHYPAGTLGELDSTAVHLYFYPDTVTGIREVSTDPVLQNWSLAIPPDTMVTYYDTFPKNFVLPMDVSLLGIFPHMHLLGKSWKVHAVSAANDTIPLIDIPEWDFHWQGFYNFKNIIKIPAGSTLYAEATYDNTSDNSDNPNDPPDWVYAGEATTDEMFLVYFQYLPYEPGDEDINLDSLITLPGGTTDATHLLFHREQDPYAVRFYPNPIKNEAIVEITSYDFTTENPLQLTIYNILGMKVLQQMLLSQQELIDFAHFRSGVYLYQITNNNSLINGGKLRVR